LATNTYLSAKTLEEISPDKLHALSLEKNQRGCATVNALKAQREIIRRKGGDVIAVKKHRCSGRLSDEYNID